ncbi:MAG: DUF3472 domain-containing protein [Verrucomicrobiae bacterium]|nr:DUF3472 domain-containing protein [Verrucomicrobiae bacterium]
MNKAVLFLSLVVMQLYSAEQTEFRAARSVHLGYQAPECKAFYLEMVVRKSTRGSYFMACGWNSGYFGIQELGDGRKVVIFSVWDPTKGDDPNSVNAEDRVECLYQGDDVRIRRFGGEGTGGQCMGDFDWEIGQTNRFIVMCEVQENKTAYTGCIWNSKKREWKKLVTFRTRTGGTLLKGLYSFVEDFRRDRKSVNEVREAEFFNVFVKKADGSWVPVPGARFTASNAAWESKDNIDAGIRRNVFYLKTGGDTRQTTKLRDIMEIKDHGWELPSGLPIDVK